MNKTNDFKFNLPAYSDPVDIEDLNDNFRGIDDALMAGLCKKDYTGNNMGSSDPSARKYAWAPWFEIVNDNEFDVVVTDRNAPVESEEATINIAAGQTFRKYINGRYYMNFYVQDQYDVTFKWFTNAETYIDESGGGGGGTGTVTSVSVQGGSGSHLTGSGNPIETSGTITINVDEGYSIPSDNEQTAWDGKAADLKAEIDSSTYVLTLQLKDSSGNLIGNERTIDLPLETMVVDGEYDSQTQKIKLELKNGNYVEFSVADLVSGLQTELSASNKLDPAYIDYDSSHRAVSDMEKGTWNGKQNALTFDDTPTQNSNNPVKSGGIYTALAGKQASLDSTQLAAVNSGINSNKVGQISTNQTNILYGLNTGVKNVIPYRTSPRAVSDTGITVSIDDDNTYKITGTKTISDSYIELDDIISSKLAGDHVASISVSGTGDCQIAAYGYNGSTWTLMLTTSTAQGFSVGSYTMIKFRIRFTGSINSSYNATVKAMVCTMGAWNQSHDWQPPALPNYDLTRLESEDRASLAEVVDSGAKNLLDFASATIAAQPNATATKSSDNLVASCTTGWAYVSLSVGKFTGNCTLSFKISELSNTGASPNIRLGKNQDGSSPAANISFTANGTYSGNFVGDGSNYYLIVYLNPSGTAQTVSLKISEVMICTNAAFGVSNKFVPYRPNYDLVAADHVTLNTDTLILRQTLQYGTDFNNILTSGFYKYNGGPANTPNHGSGDFGMLLVMRSGNYISQICHQYNGDVHLYVRQTTNNGDTWSPWTAT